MDADGAEHIHHSKKMIRVHSCLAVILFTDSYSHYFRIRVVRKQRHMAISPATQITCVVYFFQNLCQHSYHQMGFFYISMMNRSIGQLTHRLLKPMTTFQKGKNIILSRWIIHLCRFSCTLSLKIKEIFVHTKQTCKIEEILTTV